MAVVRLALAVVFLCATAWAETAAPTVTCKDGSTSKGGRGACHGHGGVDKTQAAGEGSAPAAAASAPAAPATTVTCKDGTSSKGGRGACRGHGGVDKTNGAAAKSAPPPAATAPPPSAATPPPAAAPRASTSHPTATAKATSGGKAATDDPTGALAKCKDGTYWHGTRHSGSCSHHGGVDSWLDGSQKKL